MSSFILPPNPNPSQNNKVAQITVFAGPMFAQKSSRLVYEASKQGNGVVGIKPDNDRRYDARDIITHDGLSFEKATKTVVQVLPKDSVEVDIGPDAHAVFIDEGQFFTNLVQLVESLLMQGVDVFVSTLDLDSFGNPFSAQVGALLAIAENVVKCTASCSCCGRNATRTFRKDGSHEKVKVGGGDIYEPRCLEHWNEGMLENAAGIASGTAKNLGFFSGEFGSH
jgi:thymidine kinase